MLQWGVSMKHSLPYWLWRLPCFLIAGLLCFSVQQFSSANQVQTANGEEELSAEESAPLAPPRRRSLFVIPSDDAVSTAQHYNQAWQKWFVATCDEILRQTSPDDVWLSEVTQYVTNWANIYSGVKSDGSRRVNLRDEGARLLEAGCGNELFLVLYASALNGAMQYRAAADVLPDLEALGKSGKWPGFVLYLGWWERWRSGRQLGADHRRQAAEALDQALEHLARAAADPYFKNGRQRFYMHYYLRSSRFQVEADLERHRRIVKIMQEQSVTDEWILHIARGVLFAKEGWASRGTGYAYTVTPEGWQGYHQNIGNAAEQFEQAHALRPDFPEAATEMIRIKWGDNFTRTGTVYWFNQAVAAQMDYAQSYNWLLWGLRPRWGGSHEAMYELGLAALHSGRFDTHVPSVYLDVLESIYKEQRFEGHELFLHPDVLAKVRQLAEGYRNQPRVTGDLRQRVLTHLVCVAALNGEWETVYDAWNALGGDLHTDAYTVFRLRPPVLARAIVSNLDLPPDSALLAGQVFLHYQLTNAIPLLEQQLAEASDDPVRTAALRDRLETIKIRNAFSSGEWFTFLPQPGLPGWEVHSGEWRVADDGALVVPTQRKMLEIFARSDLDANFEMTGRTKALYRSGIVLMNFDTQDRVRLVIDGNDKTSTLVYGQDYVRRQLGMTRDNTFTFSIWNGHAHVTVNNHTVFSNVPVIKDPEAAGQAYSIGFFDHGKWQQGELTDFRDVRLRALAVAPDWYQPLEPDATDDSQ